MIPRYHIRLLTNPAIFWRGFVLWRLRKWPAGRPGRYPRSITGIGAKAMAIFLIFWKKGTDLFFGPKKGTWTEKGDMDRKRGPKKGTDLFFRYGSFRPRIQVFEESNILACYSDPGASAKQHSPTNIPHHLSAGGLQEEQTDLGRQQRIHTQHAENDHRR